jgi:hypothetical protein
LVSRGIGRLLPCTIAVDIHRTGKTIALSEIEEAPEPSGISGASLYSSIALRRNASMKP